MSYQLTVNVEVIFLDCGAQSRDVDWNVDDAKE
jgi:hypothetical protein